MLAAVATLVLPHISYSALAPEMIPFVVAMLMLGLSAMFRSHLPQKIWVLLSVLSSVASLATAGVLWARVGTRGGFTAIAGALSIDGFGVLFMLIISSAMLLSSLVIHDWLEREGIYGPEVQALVLLSGSGAMLMAVAGDLIMIFLGLEIMSIALYILVAMERNRQESGEAALKYFLLGAFSSAIFLYGIALSYGATGSTNIAHMAAFLASNVVISNGVLLAGLAFILLGLGFKIAAVPFHLWTPDVYQGAPTPVTGFMAAIAKAGAFAALVRVLMSGLSVLSLDWRPVIYALAVASLVVGAVLAVVQSDIKRMLAYSSISHAGFILLGVEAGTTRGVAGVAYYMAAYSFMTVGTFAVVSLVGGERDELHDISQYRGLARRHPMLAGGFAVLLLAQSGVPLTTGFLAKFYVVGAVVANGSYVLGLIAMVSAVITAFFYLRIVLAMYGQIGVESPTNARLVSVGGGTAGIYDTPAIQTTSRAAQRSTGIATRAGIFERVQSDSLDSSAATTAVIALCVAVTVVFGIWPSPLIDFAQRATLLF